MQELTDRFRVFIEFFSNLGSAKMTEKDRKNLLSQIEKIAADSGTTQRFFHDAAEFLLAWRETPTFHNQEVLLRIARVLMNFCLARARTFVYPCVVPDNPTIVYREDTERIAMCLLAAAELMLKLDFPDDSVTFYQEAHELCPIKEISDDVRGSMIAFLRLHRASAHENEYMKQAAIDMISAVVEETMTWTLATFHPLDTDNYWKGPLKIGRREIAEMGFSQEIQDQHLLPVYVAVLTKHWGEAREEYIKRLISELQASEEEDQARKLKPEW